MIERLSEAMGANSIEISFHMKKKVTCSCPKFTKHLNVVDS